MYFPLLYAETHYHLKYLYPLYYKKEPEIITDVPIRVISSISKEVPILLIVKDAHKFPVFINKLKITIQTEDKEIKRDLDYPKKIKSPYFSNIFYINPKINKSQYIYIKIGIEYICNNKKRFTYQDNYFGLKKLPFKCFYSTESLPYPKNWFAGDAHYHSNYTSDQVEFGADIHSTKIFAKVMGLKWFFVTDHSYDLDDYKDNYLTNDPDLTKWKNLKEDIKNEKSDDINIVLGEEVSVGNQKKQNIHLLAINPIKYLSGSGDSAEKWFKNKPDNQLSEILDSSHKPLFIAAHPFENIPLIQKITLNRGIWEEKDFKQIKILQIINGNTENDIFGLINRWKNLLLQGKKYIIVAGNDAHGNFNFMKQIKIPFLKLFISKAQIFGNWLTVFKDKENIPQLAIEKGRCIVTNGPFINISLKKDNFIYEIGDSCKTGKYKINIETNSNLEFGQINKIILRYGIYGKKEINLNYNHLLNLDKPGYIRAYLITLKGDMAFTNPIWIE